MKILAITNSFLPTPNAIGVCVESLLREFKKQGNEIYVLSMDGPKSEYVIKGYNVSVCALPSVKSHDNIVVRKAKTLKRIVESYPFYSNGYVNGLYECACSLMDNVRFDIVIGTMKPYESGEIIYCLKNKYKDCKYILYELDSLTDNLANYQGYTKILKYRCENKEKKYFSCADGILHLKEREDYYSDSRYIQYRNKTRYIGIPLINKEFYTRENPINDTISIVYSGMLYKSERKPHYWISLLENYKGKRCVKCDFFSRGDWESYLKEYEMKMPEKLHRNGYVDKSVLDEIILRSNVLLSIGNCYKTRINSIPSKLLYYISTGKPIIHISPNEYDVCLPYLEKYSKAIIIKQEQNFDDNVKRLENYILKLDEKTVPWEDIRNIYKECMPEYTVDMIKKLCKP